MTTKKYYQLLVLCLMKHKVKTETIMQIGLRLRKDNKAILEFVEWMEKHNPTEDEMLQALERANY